MTGFMLSIRVSCYAFISYFSSCAWGISSTYLFVDSEVEIIVAWFTQYNNCCPTTKFWTRKESLRRRLCNSCLFVDRRWPPRSWSFLVSSRRQPRRTSLQLPRPFLRPTCPQLFFLWNVHLPMSDSDHGSVSTAQIVLYTDKSTWLSRLRR